MLPAMLSVDKTTPPIGDRNISSLLESFDKIRVKIKPEEGDHTFLHNLLTSTDFHALVMVHNKVAEVSATEGTSNEKIPETNASQQLNKQVLEAIGGSLSQSDVQELHALLSDTFFQAMLSAHDDVANKNFVPVLPRIPYEVDEDDISMKIVKLVKTNEPLGATIKKDEKTGAIFIARVMHGGCADRCGMIHVGDQVMEVNGQPVHGLNPTDVVKILLNGSGTLTFKLIPADFDENRIPESKVHVKAFFDYNPSEDNLIPCQEAGLSFRKGDVLHVVEQTDPNWWQARKVEDHENEAVYRAGLIPSQFLQERRMVLNRSKSKSPLRNDKLKNVQENRNSEEVTPKHFVPYEEVAVLEPEHGHCRPIILIGAPGVGRNELKRRLLESNPDHFKTTVPHTSRPRKAFEVDGKEYHFTTRAEMETAVQAGNLLEFGEYKGNLYGTTIDSVKSLIKSGVVGIMNPHPKALKLLRTKEIKPYIVFVKPPSLERLLATRRLKRDDIHHGQERAFTEQDFHEMLRASEKLHTTYDHVFDTELVNDDLDAAVRDLQDLLVKIETRACWVPITWTR